MMDAYQFFEMFKSPKIPPIYKLGTIDSAYTSGRPKILFDGGNTVSNKTYPYLSSYTPVAGDRVLMLVTGSTLIILGKVV